MNKDLFNEVRAARGPLLLAVALGVLSCMVTIAQMALLSHVIAGVFLGHAGLAQVRQPLLWLLVTIGARAALTGLREIAAPWGATRVTLELRARLFGHLLALGPAYCGGERTGELTATLTEGVERLGPYVGRYLPQLALSVCNPLLIVAYILPLDWASGVLLLVTGPIIPLLMILVGSYAQRRMQSQWTALAQLSAHVLDAVQGLPTLIAFGRGAAEQSRLARSGERFRERTMAVLRLAFLSGLVLELMSSVAIALVAVTLGVRLLDGGIAFERAFLVLLLAPEFYRPLRELGVHRHVGMEGAAAAERIVEILHVAAPACPDPGTAHPLAATGPAQCQSSRGTAHALSDLGPVPPRSGPDTPRHLSGRLTLTLTDLRYTYPGATRAACDGLTLTLAAGTCTAVVGRSGAGKSTLVDLLLRFVEPEGGAIAVNGVPLRSLPVELWREHVALVPQRPYLFYGSVRDNIRLARPAASDADVCGAAERAGASEFIARLPHGYDTPIGEQGARLSAGQAQRLAIARAFLKDAPLLILDEPTSSLDPESERLVRRALDDLARERTVLVVAHRLATVEGADALAILDAGRLVDYGPPAEVLRRNALFGPKVEAGAVGQRADTGHAAQSIDMCDAGQSIDMCDAGQSIDMCDAAQSIGTCNVEWRAVEVCSEGRAAG